MTEGFGRGHVFFAPAVILAVPMLVRWAAVMARLFGSGAALYVRRGTLVFLHPLFGRLRPEEIKEVKTVTARRGFGDQPYVRVATGSRRAYYVPLFQVVEPPEEIIRAVEQWRASELPATASAAGAPEPNLGPLQDRFGAS